MGTATTTPPMTAEEFFDWCGQPENEGRRYELQDGEVIEMPSPGELHGTVCALISYHLTGYAFARRRGRVTSNDTGLIVGRNPDTTRGPDLMFFDDTRSLDRVSRSYPETVPALVVEVLSPTDSWSNTIGRVIQYLDHGVPLVWVVDPDLRTVTVFHPGDKQKLLRATDALTGNGVLPDFACKVTDLFALPGNPPTAAP